MSLRPSLAGLLLSTLLLLDAAAAGAAAPLAYVTDLSGTVTVVDTLTHQVTTRFSPPLSSGFVGVAVSPDGSTVYLADGNHSIVIVTSPIDNPSFDRVLLDESLTPINLALTPDGGTLFISNASSNTVSTLDTATHAVGSIDIQCNQNGTNNCNSLPPIAVTPDANAAQIHAYVGTQTGYAIIDAADKSFVDAVPTTCGRSPCAPLGVAASADGATVFVSLFDIDQVLGIDSTMMNLVDDIAMVGTSPLGLAVTPDRKTSTWPT